MRTDIESGVQHAASGTEWTVAAPLFAAAAL